MWTSLEAVILLPQVGTVPRSPASGQRVQCFLRPGVQKKQVGVREVRKARVQVTKTQLTVA